MIGRIKDAGISNVMALRGDIPEELRSSDRSEWTYHHAIDLIREIKLSGADLCIGGACYPEIHPESGSREQDIYHLAKKVDAGCDFLTTQMFFDNGLFYRFVDDIMGAGISVPLIPGIMPITNAKQVERAINLSGCFMPPKFMELVDRYADDPASMQKAGIEYATEQIRDLYRSGIGNVHVYTMNKPEIAERIRSNVSDIIDV
jgi:methylenetetrahydrofolate reductase (NADPH)